MKYEISLSSKQKVNIRKLRKKLCVKNKEYADKVRARLAKRTLTMIVRRLHHLSKEITPPHMPQKFPFEIRQSEIKRKGEKVWNSGEWRHECSVVQAFNVVKNTLAKEKVNCRVRIKNREKHDGNQHRDVFIEILGFSHSKTPKSKS